MPVKDVMRGRLLGHISYKSLICTMEMDLSMVKFAKDLLVVNKWSSYLSLIILIGTASANSVESDLGCTSRNYFDNVTLTSHNVTLTFF